MSTPIYIAGASGEIELVRPYVQAIREHPGYRITCDWVAAVDGEGGLANAGLTPEARKKYALADLQGVFDAEIVWLLMPSVASIGCWVEFGYALGVHLYAHVKRLVVSGAHERSIFMDLADDLFATHEAALAWLRAKANT